jgi:hypothetical protein
MCKTLVLFVTISLTASCYAQEKTETRNVIIVTLDGFRWQEVFRGACPKILENSKYVHLPDSVQNFLGTNESERREKLLPFFWNTIALKGQLYGNRDCYNFMNCSNPYWFSYPGYHELFVGAVDKKVGSNMKVENPNSTVLEFLNAQPSLHNSIAAFSTWDVFPYILRESCSGIPVNSGIEPVDWSPAPSPDEIKMNAAQLAKGMRSDSTTFHFAFEYLKIRRPHVLYIALDETDHYAHKDRYDQYLLVAHMTDKWLENLWTWIQSDPEYKDHTTLILTTDHGRGQNSKKTWRHHGRLTWGSGQIWAAVIGPDTPALGEVKVHEQLYQKQIARTMAAFLGLDYHNDFEVGNTIESLIKPPALIADQKKIVSDLKESSSIR